MGGSDKARSLKRMLYREIKDRPPTDQKDGFQSDTDWGG